MSANIRVQPSPQELASVTPRPEFVDWEAVSGELGLEQSANLGDAATAQQVAMGRGSQTAIAWYGNEGAERKISFEELTKDTGKVASAFLSLGVAPGDRVMSLVPTGVEFCQAVLGGLRAGATVAVLGSVRSADAMRSILGRVRPKVMITLLQFRTAIRALRKEQPELQEISFVAPVGTPVDLEPGESLWTDVVAKASETFAPSGVSGASRALMTVDAAGAAPITVLAHVAAQAFCLSGRYGLDLHPGDAAVIAAVPGEPLLPGYSLLAPLLNGATSVLIEDPVRFRRYTTVARDVHPTVFVASQETLDQALAADPDLGAVLAGARHLGIVAPYNASFLHMTSLSFPSLFHPVWGAAECGVLLTAQPRGTEIRAGSVGMALPGATLRVLGDDGETAEPGAKGRLATLLGPGCPVLEVEGDPGRLRDGWLVTDRHGRIDPDGCVWIDA